jgi:hypothetical protein
VVKERTEKAPPAKDAASKAAGGQKKAENAGTAKPEVLPWANAPKAAPVETKNAATSPCTGLVEDGCREQKKKCAWIADMKYEDGTLVPGRCADRPQGPVKKAQAPAAAAKPKPKPEATPAAAGPADAAKAETPSAAPAAPSAAAAPAGAAKSQTPSAAPGAPPAAASSSTPVTITVNPPKPASDPAAQEGIPVPATNQ